MHNNLVAVVVATATGIMAALATVVNEFDITIGATDAAEARVVNVVTTGGLASGTELSLNLALVVSCITLLEIYTFVINNTEAYLSSRGWNHSIEGQNYNSWLRQRKRGEP
mgnify:CR=1 FL=1